jgi:hypothetical protein
MFVKLLSDRKMRGKVLKKSQIVEVGTDLGNRLILNGFATKSSEVEASENKTENVHKSIEDMTTKELIALAEVKGVKFEKGTKKDGMIAMLKESDQ